MEKDYIGGAAAHGYAARTFDALPADARTIREEVFVREQGFTEEFDETDGRAKHIVLYRSGDAVGTCRVFLQDGRAHVGRVAVRKAERGRGAGGALLAAAEQTARAMGMRSVELAAQVRAAEFYRKYGYAPCSAPFDEEGCPHIRMRKDLGGR